MNEQQDVVRDFTKARKFPFLVGKVGDVHLLGGPYTLTQFITVFAVLFGGKATMGIWGASLPALMAWGLLLAASVGAGLAIGRLPIGGRNPLLLVWGFWDYFDSPAWGKRNGNEIKIPKPTRVHQRASSPANDSALSKDDAVSFEQVATSPDIRDQEKRDADTICESESTVGDELASVPSVHQLNEVQQILAASAQRR
ncbi:MAG: hypothetical protein E7A06_12310 [Clostridiales bacterium]|nr:hypothetical protein [Clostridiales bacterium]